MPTLQPLRNLQQPSDGVPVSARPGLLQRLFYRRPRFRAAYAIGKIDVEFATVDPYFLQTGLDPEDLIASFRAGRNREECDQKLAGIEFAPLRKRVLRDYVSQLSSCTKNHSGTKAELALDRILDALGQHSEVLRVSPENHVAALYVGLRIAQAERL